MKAWRSHRIVVVLLICSGLLVGIGGFGIGAAQRSAEEPRMVFGSDIGFRITGTNRNGAPRGTLVVRVDGKWVEAELETTMTVRPIR